MTFKFHQVPLPAVVPVKSSTILRQYCSILPIVRRRDKVIQLLQAGGFALKKWVSNTPELLATINPADRLRPTWLNFCTEGPANKLGPWDLVQDCFRFVPPPDCNTRRLTKRTALAELARIFDPAGWIAPVTVIAKLAIKDLWRVKLDWDKPTPEFWIQAWLKFRELIRQIETPLLDQLGENKFHSTTCLYGCQPPYDGRCSTLSQL